MPGRFESEIPEAYARLLESRAAGSTPALSEALGAMARVLAASRPGGVFLCLGDGAGDTAAWLLDGMDLSSRLVVVVIGAAEAEALGAALGDDLRVTVHVQGAVAFLEDVRDHRFDLIADLSAEPPARRMHLALARLAPGGLLLARCRPERLDAPPAAPARGASTPDAVDGGHFVAARLGAAVDATVVARRPPPPAGKRRGGRRARAGVTPLFSSKARPGGEG